MNARFSKCLVSVLVIAALALAIVPFAGAQEGPPDYWPTAGWRTSTPEEQGMDSAELAALVSRLPAYETIDSFLVIRNGYVVTEAYWHPFTEEMDHHWFSVSKSVTSALIGIAVDMGYIASLDEKVIGFFPEYTVKHLDDNKQAMTIRSLLTMRSGFACDATTGTDPGDQLVTVEDAIQLGLDWEMADAPGITWRYCQINTYLLMAILQRTVGVPVMDFARQYLFTPIGISQVEWATSQQGIPLGFMGLFLRPTDMARFGYLYLMHGRWEDQQIVSSEWVEESTTQLGQGTWDPSASYGYQWWAYSQPGNYFTGIGAQAQFVTVYPEKNLVVVITSSTADPIGEWTSMLNISSLMPEIVRSVESDGPLPDNPEAVAALETAISNASAPITPLDVAPMPEIATQVSGVTYLLDDPWEIISQDESLYVRSWRMDASWIVESLTFDFTPRTPTMGFRFADDTTLIVPIGMDGVYRTVESKDGLVAAKGDWRNTGQLSVTLRFLMNTARLELTCRFTEDRVRCSAQTPWESMPSIEGTPIQ